MTVDLDVLVRSDLLDFLTEESKTRNATILYATHIFDGLDNFPTHISHMRNGAFVTSPVGWPSSSTSASAVGGGSNLHGVALQWLKDDRELRREAEREGTVKRTRGARVSFNRAPRCPCEICPDGLFPKISIKASQQIVKRSTRSESLAVIRQLVLADRVGRKPDTITPTD